MDKELMAKFNEALKAHGRQALSLDEAGQVSGGAAMWEEMSHEEFNSFWMEMTRNFGFNVAHQMFIDATDYKNKTITGGYFDKYTDEQKMDIVLNGFWCMIAGHPEGENH